VVTAALDLADGFVPFAFKIILVCGGARHENAPNKESSLNFSKVYLIIRTATSKKPEV
jgi:hypothetical protein